MNLSFLVIKIFKFTYFQKINVTSKFASKKFKHKKISQNLSFNLNKYFSLYFYNLKIQKNNQISILQKWVTCL